MSLTRILCMGLALLLIAAQPSIGGASVNANLTIAVADFSGPDRELGRFIADTLLTDLARSDKLRLVERTEIRQALNELRLQSTGLVEAQQVKRVGRLVSADRLLVGSYLMRDEQIIVNARLLDVRSGQLVPGGSVNMAGSRRDLLALTHRLARQFHKRITGTDLLFDAETSGQLEEEEESVSSPSAASDELEILRQRGLIPERARPNGILRERDLFSLIKTLAPLTSVQTPAPMQIGQTDAPVTRIRAIAALTKLFVSPQTVAGYRHTRLEETPPDLAQVPEWGAPYVLAAVDQGWWPADRPVRARENATWVFLSVMLNRLPIATDNDPVARPERLVRNDTGAYTGLLIDATALRLQRSMNMRILDASGNVIYPDPRYMPDYNYMLDKGLCAYAEDIGSVTRVGQRPLVVRAIGVSGPGRDDLVVSNQTAERIREANFSGRFLNRWAVCVVCRTD